MVEKYPGMRGDFPKNPASVSGSLVRYPVFIPIRQIDHAFIPLFFHWSGLFIKRQLLHEGFICDFLL